jgi:hypothetical protein
MGIFGIVTSMIGRKVTLTSNYVWADITIPAGTRGTVTDEFMQGRTMMCTVRFEKWGSVEVPQVNIR